jgi:dephospho-CoA kinase
MRSVRIGVTGKLGSGKSVLLRLMAGHGFQIIHSDDLARELMERDGTVREQLIEILGKKAYSDGKLDRAFVASQIFQDKSQLAKVEAAVHPVVTREVEKAFREKQSGVIAVESALILKSRFREIFDYIVLIESPEDASIERVVKEGRLTREEAETRLSEQEISQKSHDEADFFIENAGSAEVFEEKCRKLIGIIETLGLMELPELPLHAEKNETDPEENIS